MAATPRPPVGMDHLTVVPTNYDTDAADEKPREADRKPHAADDDPRGADDE